MKTPRLGNKALIKDMNRTLVLKTIKNCEPISKTDVAQQTGLNLSTISKICDKLYKQELIYDIEEGISSGGRRPIKMGFNAEKSKILSIKIEKHQVLFALSNLKPHISNISGISFDEGSSYQRVLDLILKEIKSVQLQHSIIGIGIACSGIIDAKTGSILKSTYLKWEGAEITKDIEEACQIRVTIENDVNCYALAQLHRGQREHSNLICLTLGEGVGGGFIINNQIYKGSHGSAGEVGHMILYPQGKKCYCGQRGCLESYISSRALEESFFQKTGLNLPLNKILSDETDQYKEEREKLINEFTLNLSAALTSLNMCFNPDQIIICLDNKKALEESFTPLQELYIKNWLPHSKQYSTGLIFQELDNHIFLEGACQLIIEQIFNSALYESENPLLD